MSEPNKLLGYLPDVSSKRDAVHVAIAPVVAGELLAPGELVGFSADGEAVSRRLDGIGIGIVDPFLNHPVTPGQRFWLCLLPGSIKGLRHEWSHPSFVDAPQSENSPVTSEHDRWLRQFAQDNGLDYDDMMYWAGEHVRSGGYWIEGGRFEGFEFDSEEFWRHYQGLTGKHSEGSFFACAC